MSRPTLYRPAPQGRTLGIVGDVYRFLVTSEETGGEYAAFEALVPPGGGPPPHVHSREEETFYVLEGEMSFECDGESFSGGPGTFVRLPIGTLHRFFNATDRPARVLISLFPAGFEQMFFEVGTPLPEGATEAPPSTPEDIQRILEACPRYGVELRVPKA